MKKIILSLICGFSLICVHAQVNIPVPQIVYDPKNFAEIQGLLTKASEQIKTFREQTSILKEAQESLNKVNTEVNNMRIMKRAITQQGQLIKYFVDDLTNVGNIAKNEYSLAIYLGRIDGYREQILDNSLDIVRVLSNNVLKMNDYERMKLVKELMQENEDIAAEARNEKMRFEEHNKQLSMLEELKK